MRVVDLLIGEEDAAAVLEILRREGQAAAPDLVVFETVSTLRRHVQRGELDADRARGAIADLDLVPLVLFPTMPLRERAWELRDAIKPADAIFVALAEGLSELLVTKDYRLARAVQTHVRIDVETLGARPSRR